MMFENPFNLPSYEQMNIHNSLFAALVSQSGGMGLKSWDDIQRINRMGLAKTMLTEGDQFMANWKGTPTVFDIVVIDHPQYIPVDPRFTHTITVQPHDTLRACQFSAPQAIYGSTAELPAGTHVFLLNGIRYKVTTTVVMPANGVLVGGGWTDYVPTTMSVYGADRKTVLESGLAVTTTSDEITLAIVNDHVRCRYGSNDYLKSGVRQWARSADSTFTWVPKGLYDMPSTYETGGFLHHLDSELVAVLGEVTTQVAKCTFDGGGQDVFTDKVFLPSRVEMGYGTEGVTTGEAVVPFYDGVPNSYKIKLSGTTPTYWALRSPYVGNTYSVRHVYPSGDMHSISAYGSYGFSPFCVIV